MVLTATKGLGQTAGPSTGPARQGRQGDGRGARWAKVAGGPGEGQRAFDMRSTRVQHAFNIAPFVWGSLYPATFMNASAHSK